MSMISTSALPQRTRSSRGWNMAFRPAYSLSLTAGFAAAVAANLAIRPVAAYGGAAAKLLKDTALLIGLLTWCRMHSMALAGHSEPGTPLTEKETRAMSARVFAWIVGAPFAVSAALTEF